MLLNSKNGGWIGNRLNYVTHRNRKQLNRIEWLENDNLEISNDDDHDDDFNPMDYINEMKRLVVSMETLGIFRRMLNATRDFRAELMTKNEVEIKEYFPYFFTHPETLVRHLNTHIF